MDEDSVKADYIQRAFTWVDAHLGQAVQSAYRDERDRALAELAEGLAELSGSDLPGDLQDQVRVRGRYMRWQIECMGRSASAEAQLRSELIHEFEGYRGSVYGENAAHTYLLQLRTLAWRDDGVIYPHAGFRADLKSLDSWGWTLEVFIYISTCAFWHRDMEVMEECFTAFTAHADGFMADYLWQRANLMYQLLKGGATVRDLTEMLRRIEHPHQWTDIERVLLPACIEQGLFHDNAACAALGALLRKLNTTTPSMPKRMNATGRIRRD